MNRKKIMVGMWMCFALLVSLPYSWAFSFKIGRYSVVFNLPIDREVIINQEANEELISFKEDLKLLNSIDEVSLFLMELGYRRIGFVDIPTGRAYTAIINPDGKITHLEIGLIEQEITLRGDINEIRKNAHQNDWESLRKNIKIPMSAKIRIMLNRVMHP